MVSLLPGIDVSNWQGTVHWQTARRHGLVWGTGKATEGLGYTDPTFRANWAAMGQYGVIRGAVHYLRPSLSGASQADSLHHVVHDAGGLHGTDFLVLDLETTDGEAPGFVIECAEVFVSRLLLTTRAQVVIYTGRGFWESLGNPHSAVLGKQPLWSADWGVESPATFGPWPLVSFWQHTGGGTFPGVNGPVDLDVFRGVMAQLHAVLKR